MKTFTLMMTILLSARIAAAQTLGTNLGAGKSAQTGQQPASTKDLSLAEKLAKEAAKRRALPGRTSGWVRGGADSSRPTR